MMSQVDAWHWNFLCGIRLLPPPDRGSCRSRKPHKNYEYICWPQPVHVDRPRSQPLPKHGWYHHWKLIEILLLENWVLTYGEIWLLKFKMTLNDTDLLKVLLYVRKITRV